MDAFDSGDESDSDEEWQDDRQRQSLSADENDEVRGGVVFDRDQNVSATEQAGPSAQSEQQPPPPPPPSSFEQTYRSSRRQRGGWRSIFSPFRRHSSAANNNDGVFANLTAKPDPDKPNDDQPPTYEEAAMDATPPYWETTIMAPGITDELFIEGLPVGSPINFIWNMMVSAAFQFVGFFLTYLLHTSHAAKHGSRAGLGFTLLQCGYYLRPEPAYDQPTAPPAEFEPSNPNDFDVSVNGPVSGQFTPGHPSATITNEATPPPPHHDTSPASWISTALMVVGVIIILKSVNDYFQARRMELAILSSSEQQDDQPHRESSPEEMV